MLSGMTGILLLRHGQTGWSAAGRHTGRSDIPLTDLGRAEARLAGRLITAGDFDLVLCSPMQRATETARLAGLTPHSIDEDLLEWDYGAFEGLTLGEIRRRLNRPAWVVWDGPIPPGTTPGESPEDVARRANRVIRRCEPVLAEGGDCALVGHGHQLRILSATWLGLTATDGRLLGLDTGSLSRLGFEREQRVISGWNRLPSALTSYDEFAAVRIESA